MPQATYDALLRALKSRAQGSVFFFHGDEEYLREQAVSRVVETYLDESTRDFNLDAVRGAEVAPESLASILATPPMMAEWRVVVVRDAQGLSQKGREAVEAIVANPPAGLALAVTAAIPQATRAKFYDELKRLALSVEFSSPDAVDAPGWLIEHAKDHHALEIDPDAARALVAGMGTDLGALSSETAKLAAYVGEGRKATLEDVRAVSGTLPRQDRWAWFDMIGERRFREAVATLPVLLEQGESGVGLVIGMGAQLLRIALVCAGGQGALERELKPYQKWMARRVPPQARLWTLPEVDAALTELLRADRLLKSASLNDRQAIEELLLRLWAIGAARESAA